MKIDSTNVHIDPLILFIRLTAILERETDFVENFDYELTPEPAESLQRPYYKNQC